MAIDPQDGGLDDWFVPTSPQGDADGPDDWFVPASDGYPDDWFVPASAAPATAQPALGPPPGTTDPALATRPAPRPDPHAAYWSLIPASKWVTPPPIFPDTFGRFPLPPAAPPTTPRLDAGYGLLGGLGNLPDAGSPPTYGLFGVLKNPPSANPAAFPSYQGAGLASGNGDQIAPPSLFPNVADFPWWPLPAVPDGVSNAATDGSAFESAAAPQFPFPDGTQPGAQPVNAAPRFASPLLNSQPANAAAFSFLRPAGLTSGASDQSVTQSLVQNLSPLDSATALGISERAGNYPMGPVDQTGSGGILLAQNRPRINPEDEFDPLAPVRTDIYNAARNDLQQLQPNNYALSVPSFRRLGSAPTIDEIGELKYAYRIAQSTQPLADTASRISGLVDSFGQNFRTVAVLQTTRGTFIAGSGNVELEPDQRNALVSAGATRVEAAGVDAEITALKYAKDNDRGDPQYIAASRPFCADCRKEIQGRGGLITSPITAVFPRNIPSVAFSGR
jgi:hypothetical protein